jgi:RNA polymerase sigma factor (sigma-70 family)
MAEQDQRISEVVTREQSRLRGFIRRRVPDPRDAEDILQDVFYKLVEANRLLMPIDHVTGWLFRVARNRIIDLWREKKVESVGDEMETAQVNKLRNRGRSQTNGLRYTNDEGEQLYRIEELLPSPDDGPEAVYARNILLEELELAINELPVEQREIFVAHELEGRSFKEMAAATGVSMNTLLARKRYAVLHLRKRLRESYTEFRSSP